MAIRFIHTADWQLGKPFGNFDKGLSEVLRKARLDMILRLAETAKANNVSHIIVAGDVWDQELPNKQTIKQPLDIMGAADQITWWLLPGNHDPARENGLWSQIKTIGVPSNIRLLLTPEPVQMSQSAYLLPSPWISKNPGVDNTRWMNEAVVPEDSIKIGIAHGSFKEFKGDAAQHCVISAFERVKDAELDYLALGDWHGKIELDKRIYYSGTPEIDRFPTNNPGWALIVEIAAKGAVPNVIPIKTTSHMWMQKSFDVLPGSDPADLMASVSDENTPLHRTLAQVRFSGKLPISEYIAIKEHVRSLAPSYAYFTSDFAGMEPLLSVDDLDDLDLAGSLRQTAEALIAIKDDADLSSLDRLDAGRALDLLLSYSREASAS